MVWSNESTNSFHRLLRWTEECCANSFGQSLGPLVSYFKKRDAADTVVTPCTAQRWVQFDSQHLLHSLFKTAEPTKAAALGPQARQKAPDFPQVRAGRAVDHRLKRVRIGRVHRGAFANKLTNRHAAPSGASHADGAGHGAELSLANMVPQAPRHNRGAWRVLVEDATKKYAARASGDVYVITGPVYTPSIAQSEGIGPGQVRVPAYLFKLVYDVGQGRAWAHWHLNDNATHASRPISYAELVRRTGIEFLPGVHLAD
jgi:endonuclease G, mitochondrial